MRPRRAFFQSPLRYNPAYLGNGLTADSLAAHERLGIRRSCHGCGRCLFEILELKIEENPMTRGLLSCLLVVTFGAPLQAARDEPMDAYAWLEEVTGEKPLAWVKDAMPRAPANSPDPTSSRHSIADSSKFLTPTPASR